MYFISWRNLTRRKFHTLLTLVTVAVATAVLFSTVLLSKGVVEGLDSSISRMGADIIVIPLKEGEFVVSPEFGGEQKLFEQVLFTGDPVNIYTDKNVVDKITKLPGVSRVTAHFFTQTLNSACCSLAGVNRLVGFDPDTDFVLKPWLEENSKGSLKENEIVVGGLAPATLGGRVEILGKPFDIAGRLEEVGGSIDTTIFMPIDRARKLAAESPYLTEVWKNGLKPDNLVSAILIKVDDPKKTKDIVNTITQMNGLYASAASEVSRSSKEQFSILLVITVFLAAALLAVSFLGLAGRFAALVMERKNEVGLLRALGARRLAIFRIVMTEAFLTSLAGGAAGIIIGASIVYEGIEFISARTTYPFLLPSWKFITMTGTLALAGAVLAGLLSSLYPAFRCANLDPVRAITEGELE